MKINSSNTPNTSPPTATTSPRTSQSSSSPLPTLWLAKVTDIIPIANKRSQPSSTGLAQLNWPNTPVTSQSSSQWQLALELSNHQGVYKSLSVSSTVALKRGTQLVVNHNDNNTKVNVDIHASKILLAKDALSFTNLARPTSDLAQLVQLSNQFPQLFNKILNKRAINLLNQQNSFGLFKNKPIDSSLVKQIINSNLLFPSSGKSPPNEQIKSPLLQLLNALSYGANTATPANQLTNSSTAPALIKIGELIALLLNQPNSEKPTAEIKQHSEQLLPLARRLVLQVLLGLQARQLQTTSEWQTQQDKSPNEQVLTDVQFPLHWDSGVKNAALKISKRQHSRHEQEPQPACWQFDLTLELPNEQTLTTRCALQGESCRVQFWANSRQLQQQVEQQLHNLTNAMANDDIKVDYCHCQVGEPPAGGGPTHKPIINTRA